MIRSRWPLLFLLLALGGATVWGFLTLFELRFQAGDVYPPYSSLRADPIGAKVLYDALHEAPGFTVARNYLPLDKIPGPGQTAIFYAGASTNFWRLSDVEAMETLAKSGARIIATFLPEESTPKPRKTSGPTTVKPPKKTDDARKAEESEVASLHEIAKRWGFTVAYRDAKSDADSSAPVMANATSAGIERAVPWHTVLGFAQPGGAWRVLYRCEGAPCVIERSFGHGSIVLAADSYFLSNEAMRDNRAPRLLAWLLGSKSRVVFDETHLGVEENPGIASLIRKYRLEGLLAAIFVLAALFVWHSSASFLPATPDGGDPEIVTGKDSTAGFISLLRRGIPPARLMDACLDQWKKSFAHQPGKAGISLRVEAAAAGRGPVEAYRAISRILAEKK